MFLENETLLMDGQTLPVTVEDIGQTGFKGVRGGTVEINGVRHRVWKEVTETSWRFATPDRMPVGHRIENRNLHICDGCPWLKVNHRKRHVNKWYTKSNLRRLWNGLRKGEAPGMLCHATDPNAGEYMGASNIKSGKESECGGAVLLIGLNIAALGEKKEQPYKPGITKWGLSAILGRYLMRGIPSVVDRRDEVGLPW